MAARVVTVAFQGVEARRVGVEAQFTSGEVQFRVGAVDAGTIFQKYYRCGCVDLFTSHCDAPAS